MKYVLFVFVTLFSLGLTATVIDVPRTSEEILEEQTRIYAYALSLCAPVNSAAGDFWGAGDHIWETIKIGYSSVLSPKDYPVSRALTNFVDTDGYRKAMSACFGDSKIEKIHFTYLLGLDDAIGKAAGVGTWIGIALLYKRFGVSRWARLHPQGYKYAITMLNTLGVGALGIQALGLYQERRAKNKIESEGVGLLNPSAPADQDLRDSTLKLLKDRLREIDAEIAQGISDPERFRCVTNKRINIKNKLENTEYPFDITGCPLESSQ